MSDVFISYSRANIDFARQLFKALHNRNYEVWIDLEGIRFTADWWEEIKRGIENTRNFVLVMSSNSLASPVCHLEIEYARKLNKRIILLAHQVVDKADASHNMLKRLATDAYVNTLLGDRNPMKLFDDNWYIIDKFQRVNFPDDDQFDTHFDDLHEALQTDLDHVNFHTRMVRRELDWERSDRNESYLLFGDELHQAETWLIGYDADAEMRKTRNQPAKIPAPTDDQREYIAHSRAVEDIRLARLQKLEDERQTLAKDVEQAKIELTNVEKARNRLARSARVIMFIGSIVVGILITLSITFSGQSQQLREEADALNVQILVAEAQLTAIPPTLDAVASQVAQAEARAEIANAQVTEANLQLTTVAEQVAQANIQLTQVAQLVQDAEGRIESLRLASEAANIINEPGGNAQIATLLGIRALSKGYTTEADAVLVRALDNLYTRRILTGHTGSVNSVAFSPDGRYVLSGSNDDTLRLWDVASGEEVRVFTGHRSFVYSVAFSPDGRYALSGSSDDTLRLWDVATGEIVRVFRGHTDSVYSVVFSADGRYALSGSRDSTLRLWNVETGEKVRVFTGHTSSVNSVAFSPDGRYVLSGGDSTLRLWDVASGEEVRVFRGHTDYVNSVAFSPDGRYALSGSHDTTLRLWDVASGEEVRVFIGHTDSVNSVAFSPDGRYALSGSGSLTLYDNTLRLWEVRSGEEVRIFTGHSRSVNSVAFSPDGRYALSSGSWDGTLRLWSGVDPLTSDVASGDEVRVFTGHMWGVYSVVFSPDGRYALSGSQDLRLWSGVNTLTSDVAMGEEVRVFKGHTNYVYSVAFSPDGRYALSGSGGFREYDNTLRLWGVASGEQIRVFRGHTDDVNSVAFSPDGRYALSGSDDRTLRLWDVETGEEVRVFRGHTWGVESVAFSPDGRYILSGSWDDTLRLWDVASGDEVRLFTGHTSSVNSVAFSPDGRYALSGSFDGTLRLWDVASGEEVRVFTGHTSGVLSVAFSPDGRYALSGSNDRTLRLWDVANGEEVRVFTGHTSGVLSVAFSPDGRYILSGSWDNTLRLWDVDYRDFITYACARVVRDLTYDERELYNIRDENGNIDLSPTCPQFEPLAPPS